MPEPVTLDSLLATPEKDDVLDALIVLLQMGGFPTAAWQSTSLPRELSEAEAEFLSDLAQSVRNIAAGGYNSTAAGDWLTLLSSDWYGNDRKGAIFTDGVVTLKDAAGVGPVTRSAGTVWVAARDGERRFVITQDVTIPLNGSVPNVTVRAESAGSDYNVGTDEITDLATSIAGIEVSNPDPGTGTWITTFGADDERDATLQQRNDDKWTTIGTSGTDGAYRYWAQQASTEVRRAKPVAPLDNPGVINVYLAADVGTVTEAVRAAADAVLQVKARPLGLRLFTYAAAVVAVRVGGSGGGTVYVKSGYDAATVLAKVQAALDAFFASLDLGPLIYASAIIGVIQAVEGVSHWSSTTLADVTLDDSQVAVPDYTGLTTFYST